MLQRCWAYSILFLGVAFSVGAWFSALNGGLGVGWEDGRYVARQGEVVAFVDHRLGTLVYASDLCVVIMAPIAIILTLAMFIRFESADLLGALKNLGNEGRGLAMGICCVAGGVGLSFVVWLVLAVVAR